MPLKPLPPKLVQRLKNTFGRAPQKTAMLQRMKNADHRQKEVLRVWDKMPLTRLLEKPARMEKIPLGMWGGRVRQMNIARNYPGTELILKAVHPSFGGAKYDAKATIGYVRKIVREHNKKYGDEKYKLLAPKAYAINPHMIAMSKTDAPNLQEVLPLFAESRTERGKKMLEELRKQGFTAKKIGGIASLAQRRTGIRDTNLLLIGAEKGRLLFLPLVDVT